ncbi:MAG: hypothetical protein A2746_02025 [Candidatus Yanofskybacteria bacterium RIFCSPHIGHO2_01_FULL_44_22]|uniref:Uncharacterized protein n=1 Tax=Candidatus Yanofskybacteria bacterium RIFCSPHIGHO2_01_FULL_44_22 TaxID=1802669 RepID=A0A1F8EY56_9BACT|nr:MAG: hypothetical protein A2746_02025 [Candidatus Yanofskybacteria bacterium RIFCSPHIGHO2_01_FULL_44_22]
MAERLWLYALPNVASGRDSVVIFSFSSAAKLPLKAKDNPTITKPAINRARKPFLFRIRFFLGNFKIAKIQPLLSEIAVKILYNIIIELYFAKQKLIYPLTMVPFVNFVNYIFLKCLI